MIDFNKYKDLFSRSVSHFPVTYFLTLLIMIGLLIATEADFSRTETLPLFIKIAFTGIIIFPFYYHLESTSLIYQKNNKLWWLLAVVITALIYYLLSGDLNPPRSYRITGVALSIHLLSLLLARKSGETEEYSFWKYATEHLKNLFQSIGLSLILYLILVIALKALDHLFNLNIDYKRYIQLAMVVFTIINVLVFTSLHRSDSSFYIERGDHKEWKIVLSYILVPAFIIYTSILYLFIAKVIVTQELPQGWVAKTSMCFIVLGVLIYLISYPLSDHLTIQRLTLKIAKKYNQILIVPTLFLGFSLFYRINEYGWTELRYLGVLIVIITSTLIALQFLYRKYPLSSVAIGLGLGLIVFCLPVIGASDTSIRSQTKRFITGLTDPDLKGKYDLNTIGFFLENRNSFKNIIPLIPSAVLKDSSLDISDVTKLSRNLKREYGYKGLNTSEDKIIRLIRQLNRNEETPIWITDSIVVYSNPFNIKDTLWGDSFHYTTINQNGEQEITIRYGDTEKKFYRDQLIKQLDLPKQGSNDYAIPSNVMQVEIFLDDISVLLVIDAITLAKDNRFWNVSLIILTGR